MKVLWNISGLSHSTFWVLSLGLVVLLASFKNSLPISITTLETVIVVLIFAAIIQLYTRKRSLKEQEKLRVSSLEQLVFN